MHHMVCLIKSELAAHAITLEHVVFEFIPEHAVWLIDSGCVALCMITPEGVKYVTTLNMAHRHYSYMWLS